MKLSTNFCRVLSFIPILFGITGNLACFADSLQLSTRNAKQGETVELRVLLERKPDAAPVVKFNKRTYPLFAVGNNESALQYQTLLTVPALLKPGTYSVSVGDALEKLTVASGGFGVQRLRLPKSKDNFISSPGEEETVNKAKKTLSAIRLWSGPFLQPNKGRVTTRYGLRRIVNGRLLSDYFHSGIDFAGGLGSIVRAAQRGKVIIAHTGWRLHGNTVALDHGQGVISFYIHLNKVLVREGDMVEAGQTIGQVGQTGRASGPHLHFSIYVNQDATNPVYWLSKGF